jgi:RNA polymerase sigma-70 factor (ECF subfamily)
MLDVDDGAGGAESLAFPDVYRKHFGFVWRTLRRLGVREADQKDVTQNVFLIVHRKLPGFEGRAKLTTWLFAICRRVVKDYFQSPAIRHEVLVDARHVAARVQTVGPAQLRRLDAEELSKILEVVLDKLPEKLRTAFVLFELEEVSGDDIAQLLDVPVGTVRSRLRLAREAFQREVKLLEADEAGQSLGHLRSVEYR